MKLHSIKAKLLITNIVLILVVSTLLTTVNYIITYSNTVNRAIDFSTDIINQVSLVFEGELENMITYQNQNVIYYEIADILFEEGTSVRSDIEVMQSTTEFLDLIGTHSIFESNFILSNDNKIYIPNTFNVQSTYISPYIEQYFSQDIDEDNVGRVQWIIDDENNLYFWRSLLSVTNGFVNSGKHVVQVDTQHLFDKCGTYYLETDQQIYLADGDMKLVTPQQVVPDQTERILAHLRSTGQVTDMSHGVLDVSFEGDRYIIQTRALYDDNLYALSVTPISALLSDTEVTLYYFALLCGIAIFFSVLLTVIYISRMTKNLNVLTRHLNTFTADSFKRIEMPKKKDEISDVINTFNIMGQRNMDLIQDVYVSKAKQRNEELRALKFEYSALQSKINPHFLCNTLETINSMAKLDGCKDISDAICILGSLLRQTMQSDKRFIPLSEELEYTGKYLEIHKLNFGDKLDIVTEVDQEVVSSMVPRLILQPLVENCIMHGLENSTTRFTIHIKAERVAQDLLIAVTDNGCGISKQVMEALLLNQQKGEQDGNEASDKHIGINSVHKRLQILYGEQYGTSIKSTQDMGTTVAILLPYNEQGESDV